VNNIILFVATVRKNECALLPIAEIGRTFRQEALGNLVSE